MLRNWRLWRHASSRAWEDEPHRREAGKHMHLHCTRAAVCGVRVPRRAATKSAARRRRVGNEKKRRSVYEEVNGKKERKKLTSECLFVCLCAKELFATKKKAFN